METRKIRKNVALMLITVAMLAAPDYSQAVRDHNPAQDEAHEQTVQAARARLTALVAGCDASWDALAAPPFAALVPLRATGAPGGPLPADLWDPGAAAERRSRTTECLAVGRAGQRNVDAGTSHLRSVRYGRSWRFGSRLGCGCPPASACSGAKSAGLGGHRDCGGVVG
ncbi:hypothetical protein FACS1894198_6920 [Clostridia bacterium]|nr:hypothetical protein FACS1894198_6920 [Clostridia bacterium]